MLRRPWVHVRGSLVQHDHRTAGTHDPGQSNLLSLGPGRLVPLRANRRLWLHVGLEAT